MFVGMGQNWPLINGYWGWVTAISELIIVVCLLWYMFEILLDTSFVKISDLYMLLLPVWVSNLIKSPTSLHLKQNKQSNAADDFHFLEQEVRIYFKRKETTTISIME